MLNLESLLIGVVLFSLATPAHAQKFSDVAQQLDAADAMTRKVSPGVPVRVQVSYQLQIPAAVHPASIEEQAQVVASSHEALYRLASHECDHLAVVNPGECRMVSMSIGNSPIPYGQQTGLSQVTGSAVFELTPRPAVVATPPAADLKNGPATSGASAESGKATTQP